MADVLTVVARLRAAKGKGDALAALLPSRPPWCAAPSRDAGSIASTARPAIPELFLFYETYADDAAFELHRKAPHLAASRERREQEGLTDGPAEVEVFRSFTD